jgi:hypothetical protein
MASISKIEWEENDLFDMICNRIKKSGEILRAAGINRLDQSALFYSIFPAKVDRSITWKWMLNQIKDGNNVLSPRNLIDFCTIAQDLQIKKDRVTNREFESNVPLICEEILKKSVSGLSYQRFTDTLMAEYGSEVKTAIRAFQNSKAEHTEDSLMTLFKSPDIVQVRLIVQSLCEIGFLEKIGENYRVPLIYRSELGITQGKAYCNGNHHVD